MLARRGNTIALVGLSLGAAKERLGCALLGELRVVVARTGRVLGEIRRPLNISDRLLESVALSLMRLRIVAHISVDVIVVGGARTNKVLRSVPVWLVIRLTASAPSRGLHAAKRSILDNDGVSKLVVARAGTIDLLGLQMRLCSQRRVEARSVSLHFGWRHALVIETRTKLVRGARRSQLNRVKTGTRSIHDGLLSLADADIGLLLAGLDFKLRDKHSGG